MSLQQSSSAVRVEVAAVGLATAQGGAARLLRGPLEPPGPPPFPVREGWACRRARVALEAPSALGAERWRALARAALVDCFPAGPPAGAPLVVASCNGAAERLEPASWCAAFDGAALLAGTPWAASAPPIVSGSCASGLQALALARALLAAGAPEAVVLAVDVLAPASHDDFEGLRVLEDAPGPPWRPDARGFLPGEGAVALHIVRGEGAGAFALVGPSLTQDLAGEHGLARAIAALPGAARAGWALGLGTGPAAADAAELAALRGVPGPASSALPACGHTLGASGPLSLALAFLALRSGRVPTALAAGAAQASDGRALLRAGPVPPGGALVVCRALGGACAVVGLGLGSIELMAAAGAPATPATARATPLAHPVLRRLAGEAEARRPAEPPDLLLVELEAPLLPPARAVVGGRLLPTAVLELTPGALPLLVARRWSYAGAALCRVGAPLPDDPTLAALRALGARVARVHVRGRGEERELDWELA